MLSLSRKPAEKSLSQRVYSNKFFKNMIESKILSGRDLILHQLQLIEDAARAIKFGEARGDSFMVKQYEHLKKKHLAELNLMLEEMELDLALVEKH